MADESGSPESHSRFLATARKVTIVTGSSVLRSVCENPLARWRDVNAVRIHGATVRVKEKLAFLYCLPVLAKKSSKLNSKTVHNLKPRSSGIILTPCAKFVPSYAFLLFVLSEVAFGEESAHSWRFLPQLKHFQKSKCVHDRRIRRQLCAKLEHLRPSQS